MYFGYRLCRTVVSNLGPSCGKLLAELSLCNCDAMKFAGWKRLNAEYAKQFGIEAPGSPPNAPKR